MPVDWQRIHRNGWRQGSICTPVDAASLLRQFSDRFSAGQPVPDGVRLVVASHSCDVVARSELETHVELCPAVPLPVGAGVDLFGGGRDPRRLRIPLIVDGNEVLHELIAPHRFAVPREELEDLTPDASATLSDDVTFQFEYWLSTRYKRRAFPNTFDERLGADNHKKIRRAVAVVSEHVQQLLYSLSPDGEAPRDTDYRVRVVILCQSGAMRDGPTLDKLLAAKGKIEAILGGKKGIAADVHLIGDEKMTYAQFADFDLWGFEELSLD
jgi:hypothetical protein